MEPPSKAVAQPASTQFRPPQALNVPARTAATANQAVDQDDNVIVLTVHLNNPDEPAIAVSACHLKTCKKVTKADADALTLPCINGSCPYYIHRECCNNVMASFGVVNDFVTVCGKRCYNAYIKSARQAAIDTGGKKRVMWHNDGSTPSISSLSCVLDWLTSGNNYSRYRGGDGQTGDTKMALAKEVVQSIEDAGIMTARTAKDVMTKISAIETSFKKAADWLANTGQGVQDESSLKAAILRRCPYYYELYDTMRDRPSTQPILLNTDPRMQVSDDESSDEDDRSDGHDSRSDDDSDDKGCDEPVAVTTKRPRSTPLSIASSQGNAKKKKDAASLEPAFLELKEAQLKHEREVNFKMLAFREEEMELQRKKAIDTQREAAVRIDEAMANATKLRFEAEHWQIQAKAKLLRERMQLRDEVVAQDEIDQLLPSPP